MKRILVNAYLALNFGDDLFLKILFERYENVEWVLNSGDRRYKDIFKNVKLQESIYKKVLRRMNITNLCEINYKKYDLGIYIGGSMFMESKTWKQDYIKLENLLNGFCKENKPYYILGCNFGPYKTENYEKKYMNLFSRAKDVCFRDESSYRIFEKLPNIRRKPDIVFQLKSKNIEKIKNSIGISLINLSGRDDLEQYKEVHDKKIKEIIETCIRSGKKITMFSFCQQQGDVEAINDIINILDKKYCSNIEVVNYDGDIDKFLTKFESMENIIGTRFHACILSQVFNQGLYPIIYSDKTYNVLNDIGLSQEYCYIKDLDKLDVKYLLETISNNKIKDKTIFKEAEKQFDMLDKYIYEK